MSIPNTPGQGELDSLMTYMNARQADLTAIVKQRTSHPGNLGTIHILSFSPSGDGVNLLLHPPQAKSNSPNTINLKLTFEPPIKDPYAVRRVIYRWRDEALTHFSVPERPKIDYYSPPSLFPYTFPLVIGLVVLAYANLGRGIYADLFRGYISRYGGRWLLPLSTAFAALMHLIIEPAYFAGVLRRHDVPFEPAVKWILTIMAFGFPSLDEFWACVEYEKVRHIYSQTDVRELPSRSSTNAASAKKAQ